MRKITTNLLLVIAFVMISITPSNIRAEETQLLFMIGDKAPWKMAWAYDAKAGWKIITSFDKQRITYFFKKGPGSDKGLNLTADNPPYKIEIQDILNNKTFIIKDKIAYEQWDDGAKSWSGHYEGNFTYNSKKCNAITVSIVQEVDGEDDYANYIMWEKV